MQVGPVCSYGIGLGSPGVNEGAKIGQKLVSRVARQWLCAPGHDSACNQKGGGRRTAPGQLD
ncbi:hypothetical protein GCM10027578_24550 [Spirosoma luteolum]